MQILKSLSPVLSFFGLARGRIFIKTHSIESRCVIEPEKKMKKVCRCVCASFSPEMLQAGAAKGLIFLTHWVSLKCLISVHLYVRVVKTWQWHFFFFSSRRSLKGALFYYCYALLLISSCLEPSQLQRVISGLSALWWNNSALVASATWA